MTSGSTAEGEFVVGAELGLHARPAGRFVSLAARFKADIEVGSGAEWVNGESVLSILSLAAARGTVLRIRATGGLCTCSRSRGHVYLPHATRCTSLSLWYSSMSKF